MKSQARGWFSGRPWLLQAVRRLTGKPHAEIAILRRIVRSGDTVFDVGANTGQYTCLFAHLVGPNGAVHAFEPIPPSFAALQRNVTRHAKNRRIILNQCALGDSEAVVKMFVPKGRFTEASLVPHCVGSQECRYEDNSEVYVYEKCPVTTIDNYLGQHSVADIALVKCDVEGAELLVMKGARSILRSNRPPMLFLEVWSGWTADFGYQPRDLFEFLEQEAGFHFYHIHERGMRLTSAEQSPVPGIFPDFLNFLCVVPSVHGDRLKSLEDARLWMPC